MKFLTKWAGFPLSAATCKPIVTFVFPDGTYNLALTEYAREAHDPLILEKGQEGSGKTAFSIQNPSKITQCTGTITTKTQFFILPNPRVVECKVPSRMPSAFAQP